jgi:hypothetical protein
MKLTERNNETCQCHERDSYRDPSVRVVGNYTRYCGRHQFGCCVNMIFDFKH